MEMKLQSYLNNIASYFKKSKSHSIGIDLGSNNLKIVELQKKGEKIILKNYALVKMDRSLSADELRDFSGEIVSEILDKMSIRKKDISIAIPSYSSLITLLEIAGETEEEIKREVEYEAAKYIPVNLNEVVFDWQIIKSATKNIYPAVASMENANKIDTEKEGAGMSGVIVGNEVGTGNEASVNKNKVLLVSVMKEISSQYQKSFNDRGLKIDSIEIDCFSAQRSLLQGQKKNYLILDIGGKVSNFIGVYEGQLLFNRNIDLAGNKITELISKSLEINEERAEKIKIEQGFESDSQSVVKNILEPAFNSILEEAQKNLKEFPELEENKIEKIILTGGTSNLKGLKDFVQNKMGIEVVYGNPWAKVEYPKEIEKKILAMGPFFGVAVGLALIGLEDEQK